MKIQKLALPSHTNTQKKDRKLLNIQKTQKPEMITEKGKRNIEKRNIYITSNGLTPLNSPASYIYIFVMPYITSFRQLTKLLSDATLKWNV